MIGTAKVVSEEGENMNSQITKNDASLESGKSYGFMGCNWTVCEFVNDGMTAVLQSHGVTEGPWPGFIMPQFGNDNYYGADIDGQDISGYDKKMVALYDSIKDIEDTNAAYGRGLYLVSAEKTYIGPDSDNYCRALIEAAKKHCLLDFLNFNYGTWLGTVHGSVYGSNCAWCANSKGIIFNNQRQQFNLIVAPAFNLNLSKIEIIGNEISKKSK